MRYLRDTDIPEASQYLRYSYIPEAKRLNITSEQVRAARALLRWEQKDLAESSKISLPAIKKMETVRGPLAAQARSMQAIIAAFAAAGVEFIAENGGGAGVRLRKGKMSDEPIYVDPSRSAVLTHGVTTVNYPTLQEARTEFDRLPKERQEIATITSVGRTYTPSEINRMHYGPKPSA